MTPDQEAELGRLMVEAQQGDRQAYERLLTRVASLVRAFVRRRVGDAAWSDDVVQESLMALHRARHTYDTARPFAPWMYAIAQNRLVDALRVQRRRLLREIQPELAPEPSRRPKQERDALMADVRKAVAGLPDKQRQVIQLLKFEELSVREVANRLGMSEANVKVTAHRGYRALRRQIEEWTSAD
ncbi:MAG: sigma-70 family RNA polymerase sigma factor [Acidobacteriota bacterium]